MADSDDYRGLKAAGTLAGTDVVPCVQGVAKRKTTVAAIGTYVAGAGLAVTGSFAGSLTGVTSEVLTPVIQTATGIAPVTSFLQLNSTTPLIASSITPTVGLLLVVTQKDAGTAGHTLTTACTFDGTNNTATFNAANETLVLFGLTSTRWAIISNIGSVGLSAV